MNMFRLKSYRTTKLHYYFIAYFSLCVTETCASLKAKVFLDGSSDNYDAVTDAYTGSEINRSRPIIPKCCDLGSGFTFENQSTLCIPIDNEFLPDFEDLQNYSRVAIELPVNSRYEYFIGDPCSDGKYILDEITYPDDKYSLYSNGTLLYLDNLYSKEEFCTESVDGKISVFVCFGLSKSTIEKDFTFILYAAGLLISIPFLLATAAIYLSIDLLRDLRGKSLSCHVICLAIAYLFLAIVQLASDKLNEEACIAAGFTIQFFFVAAFFWLNIICYDTWRCINHDFSCLTKSVNTESEKIVFCYYFIYGFYGPVILSIVSLIMDFEPAIPDYFLKPNFGFRSCWFYSDEAALPYFYGPVGLTILINIVFFILSARKIYLEHKRQLRNSIENKSPENKRPRKLISIRLYITTLQECVYLFCLMGINWATEILSWALGGSWMIWLLADIINTFQGILIFYLFVMRSLKVRREVRRRLRKLWRKIITCTCCQKECDPVEASVSRHWHANIGNETEETCFETEISRFL